MGHRSMLLEMLHVLCIADQIKHASGQMPEDHSCILTTALWWRDALPAFLQPDAFPMEHEKSRVDTGNVSHDCVGSRHGTG